MLEEQQLVADAPVGAGGRESLLEVPRVAIRHPAQPPRSDRPILHGSHDSRRPTALPSRAPVAVCAMPAPSVGPPRHASRMAREDDAAPAPAPGRYAFPRLFTPLQIGPVTLRNRIVSSGHDTVMAVDGLVSDRLVAYQEARARGRGPDRRPGRGRPPDRALHLARADRRRRPLHPGVRAAGRGRPCERHRDLLPAVPRRPRDHGHGGRDARRGALPRARCRPSAST